MKTRSPGRCRAEQTQTKKNETKQSANKNNSTKWKPSAVDIQNKIQCSPRWWCVHNIVVDFQINMYDESNSCVNDFVGLYFFFLLSNYPVRCITCCHRIHFFLLFFFKFRKDRRFSLLAHQPVQRGYCCTVSSGTLFVLLSGVGNLLDY